MYWRYLTVLTLILFASCDYYVLDVPKNYVGQPKISQGFFNQSDFSPCYPEKVFPHYYNGKHHIYGDDKKKLKNHFLAAYDHQGFVNENGLITIRFIINCKGEPGAFSATHYSFDYKQKSKNNHLEQLLIDLTKSYGAWQAIEFSNMKYDSFFHLTFKIENGELVDILP